MLHTNSLIITYQNKLWSVVTRFHEPSNLIKRTVISKLYVINTMYTFVQKYSTHAIVNPGRAVA